MKVVILCGGKGTRLAEETVDKPKPLVELNDRPILEYIMRYYYKYNFKNFVLALGYKGELIKNFFLNYDYNYSDLNIKLKTKKKKLIKNLKIPDWNIDLIDTGRETLTGGRLLRLKSTLHKEENFMLTYGDGLCDVNLKKLIKFHLDNKKIATVTAVRPMSRFGNIQIIKNNVISFKEKIQQNEGWINGGFFVFNKKIFNYLSNDQTILEQEPMTKLVKDNQIAAYKHEGFWACMDTLRDKEELEKKNNWEKIILMKFKETFSNKKILITGNTGFKGCWLTLWFLSLGGNVVGISNGLPSKPSLFKILNIKKKIKYYEFDITNYQKLSKIVKKEKPDFIFHLAAQALVLRSYRDTLTTLRTNVLGTANILETLKFTKKKCVCLIITSDKCYENLELKRGYKESDLLGGKDMYSSSKASAEIITSAYFRTFLKYKRNIKIGIARAGNVIGGGDWAENRIIPDWYRCFSRKKILNIRYPNSTRPWQHVLEPLSGYLTLAMNLSKKKKS